MCMILTKLIGPYNMKTIKEFFNLVLETLIEARKARAAHLGK